MSFLEGILFSRGDERIGALLETAFAKAAFWWLVLKFCVSIFGRKQCWIGNKPGRFHARTRDQRKTAVGQYWLWREPWIFTGGKAKINRPNGNGGLQAWRLSKLRSMRFFHNKNIFAAKEEKQTVHEQYWSGYRTRKKISFNFQQLDRAGFLFIGLSAALVRALRRSSIALAYSIATIPIPKSLCHLPRWAWKEAGNLDHCRLGMYITFRSYEWGGCNEVAYIYG